MRCEGEEALRRPSGFQLGCTVVVTQIGNRRRSRYWGKVVNLVLESLRCLEMSSRWIGWSLGNGFWSADWGLITLSVVLEDIQVDEITRKNIENEKRTKNKTHGPQLLRQLSVPLLFYLRVFQDPFMLWIKYLACSVIHSGHCGD